MGGKYDGCTAFIYDIDGNMLTTSKIIEHNYRDNSIEVPSSQVLFDNRRCEVFIISSPTPYTCSGIIHPNGTYVTIKMFRGKEKDNRRTKRYNVAGTAEIYAYIYLGKKYGLHRRIKIELLNISRSGVRFRASFNALSKRDDFSFQIELRDKLKLLTAEVVNLIDNGHESSEYGCVLTGKDDEQV